MRKPPHWKPAQKNSDETIIMMISVIKVPVDLMVMI